MKIRLDNNIEFKILQNNNNKGLKPKGMFWNIPKVKHNGEWYNCTIRFDNNVLIISSLILHEENSCLVLKHIDGDVYRVGVNKFKKHLILYLYNQHAINYKLYSLKKNLFNRRKTILVFTIAILVSMIYYLANIYSHNLILIWISNSLVAQTIIIFLTLSGFINIFTPFTIQKEITENDIKKISNSEILEQQKKDKQNKTNIDRATL